MSVRARSRAPCGLVRPASKASVSKTTMSSRKDAASATTSPVGASTSDAPSKTSESLPPTWFTITTRAECRRAMAASISRRSCCFPHREVRRGGDIQDKPRMHGQRVRQRRPLSHQVIHRINRVQPARPEALVVPCILANRYRQRFAVDRGQGLPRRRLQK